MNVSDILTMALCSDSLYNLLMYDFTDAAVGHNLGGMHPFYDKEIVKIGETGGLMDYGL